MLPFFWGYGNLYRYWKIILKGEVFAKRTIQIYIKYKTLLLLSITLCVVIQRSSCLLTANALLYLPKYPQMYIRRNSFFMQVDTMPSRVVFLYPLTLIHWDFFYAKYRFVNSRYCTLGWVFTMLGYICFLFKQCLFCLLYYVRIFSLWIFNRECEKGFFFKFIYGFYECNQTILCYDGSIKFMSMRQECKYKQWKICFMMNICHDVDLIFVRLSRFKDNSY